MRELLGKMTATGLSPKTIVNHAQVVKLVVASAVNNEGEHIYPRTWNHDFIGLPSLTKQSNAVRRVTQAEFEEILSSVKQRYRFLFALLAGTGLRIGEALGLKTSDLSDCCILHVRRSVWHGKEQEPKTSNAIRTIDIPEVLARVLRVYVAGNSGYLFATANGRPLLARNVLRVLHDTGKRMGFHACRRYRAAVHRKRQVPENLIALWLGHSPTLTDRYATQLRADEQYRSEWSERAGLSFPVVTLFQADVVPIEAAKVACTQ